jgi:hypothetical protein
VPGAARHRADFDALEDPLVYTPGDNEWTDCHRANNGGYTPTERLDTLREVFFDRPGWSLGHHPKRLSAQRRLHVQLQGGDPEPERVAERAERVLRPQRQAAPVGLQVEVPPLRAPRLRRGVTRPGGTAKVGTEHRHAPQCGCQPKNPNPGETWHQTPSSAGPSDDRGRADPPGILAARCGTRAGQA